MSCPKRITGSFLVQGEYQKLWVTGFNLNIFVGKHGYIIFEEGDDIDFLVRNI